MYLNKNKRKRNFTFIKLSPKLNTKFENKKEIIYIQQAKQEESIPCNILQSVFSKIKQKNLKNCFKSIFDASKYSSQQYFEIAVNICLSKELFLRENPI